VSFVSAVAGRQEGRTKGVRKGKRKDKGKNEVAGVKGSEKERGRPNQLPQLGNKHVKVSVRHSKRRSTGHNGGPNSLELLSPDPENEAPKQRLQFRNVPIKLISHYGTAVCK